MVRKNRLPTLLRTNIVPDESAERHPPSTPHQDTAEYKDDGDANRDKVINKNRLFRRQPRLRVKLEPTSLAPSEAHQRRTDCPSPPCVTYPLACGLTALRAGFCIRHSEAWPWIVRLKAHGRRKFYAT